ncbi:MAG: hypothetical protein OQK75_12700 [Gammaproteobacteria bacterium]|nr:hypothetical protein [Gammaproteobacteria bacterium]MCW8988517.1 hypothetical protein [Gammaproteobacteria bacterium]MCW9032282.1 hypothetical protein [Gammaproteobacteria bacterium]
MLHLIKVFWDICRLRAGPQDLPKEQYLLVATILAGIIVDSFASSILMPNLSGLELVKIITVYNIILLTVVYLLLRVVGYPFRGIQTLTAFAGAGVFIALVLLPGLLIINSAEEQARSFVFYILADTFWRIAVNSHIFRHAFSISLLLAMILSVSYFIFGLFVADLLIPAQNELSSQ